MDTHTAAGNNSNISSSSYTAGQFIQGQEEPLPPGWERNQDSEGRTYCVNLNTRIITFKLPSAEDLNTNNSGPPQLSVPLPSISDIDTTVKPPKDAHLPVDVLLLTVKNCEFLACYMQLKNPYRCWFDGLGFVYFEDVDETENQEEKLKVALMRCYKGSCGPGGSLISIKNAVTKLRPKAVISAGICSGLKPDESNLGDVVVSAKLSGQSTGMRSYVSRRFLNIIKHSAEGWRAPLRNSEAREINVFCDGEFLSGPEQVRAEWRREQLTESYPQAAAVELEGEGLFTAAFDDQIEWLIVKGIADYADGAEITAESWRPFASVMAASVVSHILSDPTVFSSWPHYEDSSPAYVKARGPRAIAAYHRALATGKTCDKRVKSLLVGQDGVGKTSLAKALRGEPFNPKESSTDGVEMASPVKNAGVEAWRNPETYENLTMFDHKVSTTVSRELRDVTTATEPPSHNQTHPSKKEFQMPGLLETQQKTPKQTNLKQDRQKKKMDPLYVAQDKELAMPPEVVSLVEEQLKEDEISQDEKIWPIIWDFAGQDIYRAIHPIFMSQDDIYVLVFDLTKQLNARAECRVRLGEQQHIVPAHDSEDTNLDHMLRWLDLINSLQNCSESDMSSSDFLFPPVIVVGTHATSLDPETDIALIQKICSFVSEKFQGHIVKCLPIDNTKAGMTTEQEKIVTLRREILDLADKLPHTKKQIPLQWHLVEKEISSETWQQRKYLQKQTFREEIASPICTFESEDDFDELLYFLHARGSIIYHEHSLDQDGLVILDSQWLINVLCEIVKVTPCCKGETLPIRNDRKELKEKGILSQRLLNHACKNQNLDPIKGSLISLMEKFNLICRWPGSSTENSLLLVPCMLSPTAKEENAEEEVPEPVYLTFDGTNYVPSGLFCRLVVLFGRQLSDVQHRHKYRLYANKAMFALDKDHDLQLVCYKTVIKVRISVAEGISTSPKSFNKIVSFCSDLLHKFLKTLKNECHWLRSVTENVCARCTVCLGKSTKSCFRHNKEACRHHDCSHYLPLNSDVLCCEPGSPRLSLETLKPWIQALKKLESTDNTAPKRNSSSVSSTEDSNEYETAAHEVVIKDGVVEDKELEELSEMLGISWEALARRLGFKRAQITGFHKDNEEYAKKALGMLEKWKEKYGSDATYRVLYEALCDSLVERRDLAEQFCIVHHC